MNDIEIRRIKAKLKLFEQEGFDWILSDIIDATITSIDCLPLNTEEKISLIKGLKNNYWEKLQELCPPDNKQGKLDI